MEPFLLQFSNQELLFLALGALATGSLAGVLSGLLGVGGGAIMVPFLYYTFSALGIDTEVRMHLAVGTSLAVIVPTSLRSLHGHWRASSVDRYLLLNYWFVPLLVSAILGGILSGYVPDLVLRIFFAFFFVAFGSYMLTGRENRRLRDRLPSGLGRWVLGSLNGLISTLLGIGGGVIGVTSMVSFGVPIHRAVGTAAGFGVIIALPGAFGFALSGWGLPSLPPWSFGYVSGICFLLMAPAAILSAIAGVQVAHLLPRLVLRRLFALFLLANGIFMVTDVIAFGWRPGL